MGPAAGTANLLSTVLTAVRIDPSSGEVTILYTNRVAEAVANILVLSPHIGVSGTEVSLPVGINSFTPPENAVKWRCRAAGAATAYAVALTTAPTLLARYAPSECR